MLPILAGRNVGAPQAPTRIIAGSSCRLPARPGSRKFASTSAFSAFSKPRGHRHASPPCRHIAQRQDPRHCAMVSVMLERQIRDNRRHRSIAREPLERSDCSTFSCRESLSARPVDPDASMGFCLEGASWPNHYPTFSPGASMWSSAGSIPECPRPRRAIILSEEAIASGA